MAISKKQKAWLKELDAKHAEFQRKLKIYLDKRFAAGQQRNPDWSE